MNLKSTCIASVALAAATLVLPPLLPGLPFVTSAEARTNVSINVFFDSLSPHGSWVSYRNNYVFVPNGIRAGWRPYTLGHWVYADTYGWTWASDEPFGWATYHYGRWGFDDQIGWYWVPGTRWAPAWVGWRRSPDYVVWAPLPPQWDDHASISISFGNIPRHYWIACPTRSFLDVDLRIRIVDRDDDRRRIFERSSPLGFVRVRDNVAVNNVVDVNVIEKETGKKVRRIKVRETDIPREAKAGNDQVTAFKGTIENDKQSKPPRVSDIEEVKKARRDRGEAAHAQNGEDQTTAEQQKNGTAVQGKDNKNKTEDRAVQIDEGQPGVKPKETGRPENQPAAEQQNRKSKQEKAKQRKQESKPAAGKQKQQKQKNQKKKLNQNAEQPDAAVGKTSKQLNRKKNRSCDPSNPSCQRQ